MYPGGLKETPYKATSMMEKKADEVRLLLFPCHGGKFICGI